MARRFLFVVAAAILCSAALPVDVGAQTAVPPNAYLARGHVRGCRPPGVHRTRRATDLHGCVEASVLGRGRRRRRLGARPAVGQRRAARYHRRPHRRERERPRVPEREGSATVRDDGEDVTGLYRVRRPRLVQPRLHAIPASATLPDLRADRRAQRHDLVGDVRGDHRRRAARRFHGADRLGALRRPDVDPDRGAKARRARRAVAERVGLRLVRRARSATGAATDPEARAAGRRALASVPRRPGSRPLCVFARGAHRRSREPAGLPGGDRRVHALRGERRGSQLQWSRRHDRHHGATRDHRVPDAGGSGPLSRVRG